MRILVADDELLARKRLVRLVEALPDAELVGQVEDGAAVLAFLAEQPVDVVLLDIDMPGLSGVEAMQLWPADGPAIVFTTAHAEHALAAFEGGAIDYVLKPVEPARLQQALDRVRGRRGPGGAGAGSTAGAPAGSSDGDAASAGLRTGSDGQPRLALPTPSGLLLLRPEEITCARLEGPSTVVRTDRGQHYTDLSLSELDQRLAGRLRRVHRQALVNLARVLRLQDNGTGGYLAHLDDGGSVPVSRKVARELRRELGGG